MTARNQLLRQSGVLLILFLLLVVIASIFRTVTPVTQPSVPEPVSSDAHFLYAPANVQFDITPGWVLATNTVALPHDMSGLRFAFTKPGTPCVFAYVRMTSAEREAYVQTSFAERIFSGPNNANQFDSSWYIRKAETPLEFAFDWNARQPFNNEVRIMPPGYLGRWEYGDHFRAFLLYDADGSIVPDACNADVNGMLSTLVEYYPTARLDQSATGSLYIKDTKVLLLGTDDVARLVYQLPGGSTDHTIAGNFLYYRVGAELHQLNVFTLSDVTVAVPPLFTDANRSFIISHGSVFSLSEGNCMPEAPCKQKLYDTNLASGKTAFLGDVHTNTVMGYSTLDQAIYVEWAWGDAGCSSASVSRYSIIGGVVESVKNFAACAGDENYDENAAAYSAVRARIDGGVQIFTHMDLRNGALVVPESDIIADAGAFPLYVAQ